jgi:glutathione S-transferase
MLTLYHMPMAICAQKVRVCLAEKGLEWESRIMTGKLRSPEYLALNSGGYVPTLVHDDRIVTESRIINEYLEDAFPSPPLSPDNAYDRAREALWTKQIDDSLHLNVFTLSLAAGFLAHFLTMTPEQLEVNMPFDLTKRVRTLDILQKRLESVYVAAALQRFAKLTEDMERALGQSTWLVGETYSMADVDYTPYVQRMEDLGLSFMWTDKPALQRWIGQVRARPSYAEVVERWTPADERARNTARAQSIAGPFAEVLAAA